MRMDRDRAAESVLEPFIRKATAMAHRYIQWMLRTVLFFFALCMVADAQNLAEIDFGIRGGLLTTDSFQANQLCSGAGCLFGTRSFTAETLRGTVGPAVSVLFYDRVEARFEAVRRRFGYEVRTDLVNPPITEQHIVESTHGHLWEYPLLATYRFSPGPLQPFAGGGISLGTSGSTRRDSQFTSTTSQGPLTTFEQTTFALRTSAAYYLVGGVDGRTSYVSIRPEFRYSRFPGNSSDTAILKRNQFQFLIGISVHPFRIRK